MVNLSTDRDGLIFIATVLALSRDEHALNLATTSRGDGTDGQYPLASDIYD